jgi:hypothetical protein
MEQDKKRNSKVAKIIAISAIGVLIIAGLTLNLISQEPPSLAIKLSVDGKQFDEGKVKDGGIGDELKETYIIDVENQASTGGRNVTLGFEWIQGLTGWNVSAKFLDNNYGSIVISPNSVEQAEVTVIAPFGAKFNEKTVVKVYALEYLANLPGPPLEYNTTNWDGNTKGVVELTTSVVKAYDVNIGTAGAHRTQGLVGDTVSYNILLINSGYHRDRYKFNGDVTGSTRQSIWPNAVTFDPDTSDALEWNQVQNIRMDLRIPLDAEKGSYIIETTASGDKSSNTFYFYIDVQGPDLYVDNLWSSHNPVLNGETITIYAKIANKGSGETEKFGVEISIETPEGEYDIVGTTNISGLNNKATKTVSFKYTIDTEPGILNIQAYVDYIGKIDEEDNGNNIVKTKIEVVNTKSETSSFFTEILLIIGSVSAVTVLSLYSRKKNKIYN